LRRRPPDHYTRRAREEDFPARSVFKLEEVDRRLGLLRRGDRVLDLGCSPGSWLIYAARRAGPGGAVLGIDIVEPRIALPANARFARADVLALAPGDAALGGAGGGSFDVVLSDLAPHTSGDAVVDQERSFELFSKALDLASTLLAPGGRFLAKLFFSPRHAEAASSIKERFEDVRTLRPRAVRKASREVYVAGLGFILPGGSRGGGPPRSRRPPG
jgi:23S rRNA (uridine2552-2'-O)-methyltransferase